MIAPRDAIRLDKAKIGREYVNKLKARRYDPTVSVVRRRAKAPRVNFSRLIP